MEKNEFINVVMAIKGLYPNNNLFADDFVTEVWFKQLQDLPYKELMNGLQLHCQTSKFPPTIADLRECCLKLMSPPPMSELEAWALVSRAIKNGYYGAETEFEKLPPLVQEAVGTPSNIRQWAMTDMAEIETVVASNFERTYRVVCQRNEQKMKLSANLQARLSTSCNQERIEG